jgi:uncharacterized damage-inducible protein DinB
MRALFVLFGLVIYIPGLAAAQGAAAPAKPAAAAPSNPAVASVRLTYDSVKDYLLRSVDQMSEENYAFRPTPEVRTFGQIIGHLANEQYSFCATALGEPNPETKQDFEKTRTNKAGLAEAIRASFKYCDRAYQMGDAQATKWQTIPDFGERTPLAMLVLNAAHNGEHYGNIVTYMRIKGMVPPSSQPQR